MLTRLKVSGFKNLIDVDIRFGSFTCIAGVNGVGKSNLFDAIQFLSALSDRPLIDAARSVRDEDGRTANIRSLFHRVGDQYADKMSFEAEMIVPRRGVDHLGQEAEATSTFLRYKIELAYRTAQNGLRSEGSLEILNEELKFIKKERGDFKHDLPFPKQETWQDSVIQHRSTRNSTFISTKENDSKRIITLHQDIGSRGSGKGKIGIKARSLLAENLPRTVLSDANAMEGRTAVLARKEMQSWRMLQLEPVSLRKSDEFSAPPRLGVDGSHLPATLYAIARQQYQTDGISEAEDFSKTYGQVSNELAGLLDERCEVSIDRDERREVLTLQLRTKDGTIHDARSLSDGTLRFLALAVMKIDPQMEGLICLEEPENGIHPARIPDILQLLQDIATDTDYPVDADNPLRQIIINTHSPVVVAQVPDDCLVMAELKEEIQNKKIFKKACFSCLSDTWRANAVEKPNIVQKGDLLAYLNPVKRKRTAKADQNDAKSQATSVQGKSRRVVDREDLQLALCLWEQ